MLLPLNGRIIILDDKENQALPLIRVLSKNKYPFTYHTDSLAQLPAEPYDDLRILFLDINLTDQSVIENIKSQLIVTLRKIISPRTLYFVGIWSVKEDALFKSVKEIFNEQLKDIRPAFFVSLKKGDYFQLDEETMEYVEDPTINTIDLLTEKLNNELANLDALEPLLLWENTINISSSKIIKDIIDLLKSESINEDLKKIYFKLALANIGKQIKFLDDPKKCTNALLVLNKLLCDRIDYSVGNQLDTKIIHDINDSEDFDEKIAPIINSKLLISFDNFSNHLPGNVYNVGDDSKNPPFSKLIADSIDIRIVCCAFFEEMNKKQPASFKEAFEFKKAERKRYTEYERTKREQITNTSIFVLSETTPICDYVQDKFRMNRVVPGLLWNSSYFDYLGKADYLYQSPSLQYKDKIYKLVLDFRYFTSYDKDKLPDYDYIFRLKHLILVDIQSQLSKQMNRPGLTYLE
ncbi:MAG: hypothetical protein AB2L26_00610 [Ignavibacteria bacterium]